MKENGHRMKKTKPKNITTNTYPHVHNVNKERKKEAKKERNYYYYYLSLNSLRICLDNGVHFSTFYSILLILMQSDSDRGEKKKT
jgi:hypothetical protein